MLNLIIAGALGQDAVLRQVNGANGSISVANFSVATKSKKKGAVGKPLTVWIDCSLWDKRADSLAPYLTKGKIVSISGEPSMDSYNGQNGLVLKQMLTVNTIDFLGGGSNANQSNVQQNNQNPNQNAQAAPMGSPNNNQNRAPVHQSNPNQGGYATPGDGFEQDDVPFGNFELRTLA